MKRYSKLPLVGTRRECSPLGLGGSRLAAGGVSFTVGAGFAVGVRVRVPRRLRLAAVRLRAALLPHRGCRCATRATSAPPTALKGGGYWHHAAGLSAGGTPLRPLRLPGCRPRTYRGVLSRVSGSFATTRVATIRSRPTRPSGDSASAIGLGCAHGGYGYSKGFGYSKGYGHSKGHGGHQHGGLIYGGHRYWGPRHWGGYKHGGYGHGGHKHGG